MLNYVVFQLESKYKEFEGISSSQIVDFPAKLLKGILEVSSSFSWIAHSGVFNRLLKICNLFDCFDNQFE